MSKSPSFQSLLPFLFGTVMLLNFQRKAALDFSGKVPGTVTAVAAMQGFTQVGRGVLFA